MSNDNTCDTCKFYRKVDYGRGYKPFMECDGPAASHVEVSADDDTNLNYHYQPPPTFGCNGWVKA